MTLISYQFELFHNMLRTAVYGVSDLRTVQDTADQLKVNTGVTQTYDQYYALLLSAAISYDKVHQPKSSLKRNNNNNRRIYQHDFHAHDDDWVNMDDIDDTPVFNINTHIHDI